VSATQTCKKYAGEEKKGQITRCHYACHAAKGGKNSEEKTIMKCSKRQKSQKRVENGMQKKKSEITTAKCSYKEADPEGRGPLLLI